LRTRHRLLEELFLEIIALTHELNEPIQDESTLSSAFQNSLAQLEKSHEQLYQILRPLLSTPIIPEQESKQLHYWLSQIQFSLKQMEYAKLSLAPEIQMEMDKKFGGLRQRCISILDALKNFLHEKALLEREVLHNPGSFEQFEITESLRKAMLEMPLKRITIPALEPEESDYSEIDFGNPFQELAKHSSRFIAFGGSKGGTGKTSVVANLSFILAGQGKRVIVIDVDLGAANLHTCLGIKYPPVSLNDFLYGDIQNLSNTLIDTSQPNLKFISGAKDILELANLPYTQKRKLINHIQRLQADYIFLDLGSGSTYNVIDFFRFAREGIMIISPEPTAIENVSTFIKKSVFRELSFHPLIRHEKELQALFQRLIDPKDIKIRNLKDFFMALEKFSPQNFQQIRQQIAAFKIHLILNRMRHSSDINYAQAVIQYALKFLNLDVHYAGFIREDQNFSQSIKNFIPFTQNYPKSETTLDFKKIIYKLGL